MTVDSKDFHPIINIPRNIRPLAIPTAIHHHLLCVEAFYAAPFITYML